MENKKVKVYSFFIINEEIYEKCILKKDPDADKCLLANAKYVLEDTFFTSCFLYESEEERDSAFEKIKKYFKTAGIIPAVGYVDKAELEKGRK